MFRLLSAVVTTLAPFTVAAAGHSRNYHHTASLLAKGIAVRGGDRGSSGISRSNGVIIGGCESRNHLGRQLLSSKYITIRGGASSSSSSSTATTTEYVTLSSPASGSPFHYAFPVHNLDAAKDFYGNVLGCVEGRSSEKWQDYSLHGHQIVCHWVGDDYRCQDYYNPVDGDEVPVPHFGLALTVEQFHELAQRLKDSGIEFIIEPHLRFEGQPGEQYTMFFKDPSGNNLEFKAMTNPQNLFAKYNVVD